MAQLFVPMMDEAARSNLRAIRDLYVRRPYNTDTTARAGARVSASQQHRCIAILRISNIYTQGTQRPSTHGPKSQQS